MILLRQLFKAHLFCALLFLVAAMPVYSQPQSPQFSLGTSAVDSVPQTTVVPVEAPPTQIVEHTTVYETPSHDLTRVQRRQLRAQRYAQRIDSLIESRNYMFFPNSMQEIPSGQMRSVLADYFYLGVFVDHAEVHMPVGYGYSDYIETLNFDAMTVDGYQASQQTGCWHVSFSVTNAQATYRIEFDTSTVTGETILTLLAPDVTMRYVGWLWNRRDDAPKN